MKIEGLFTLRAPLSHIGESISVTSFLVQEPLIQVDGSVEEVFCYSGNAWRGQLRDMAAIYLLREMGEQVSLDSFHLLFSGGKIGGSQVIDIEKIKRLREAVPMIALFGGGVGNMLMPGLMRVGNCYPLCSESAVVIPERFNNSSISYSDLTFEKEFSRKDDAKNPALFDQFVDGEPESEKKGPADQMRMGAELVAAGTKLYSYIDTLDGANLGVLVSALTEFSKSPFIGGQNNKGHGLVSLNYSVDGDAFVNIDENGIELSQSAQQCLSDYSEMIAGNREAAIEALS